MPDKEFYVKFWGVRGSVPVSGRSTCEYGGNTSCLEIGCGERLIMLDAGSGAFLFGKSLKNQKVGEIDVLFSHCHYDHIEGAPFFEPAYCNNWKIRYWSGHLFGTMTTEQMIETYMRRPYFPVGPEIFDSQASYHDFKPGSVLELGDGIVVRTTSLNHPDGAVGYRVEYDGRSICYVTDMEHTDGEPPQELCDLVRDAGILIYDAMYDDDKFEKYKGFGHSTWQEGARLSDKCNVGQYVAFHHQPAHDDLTLNEISRKLEIRRPGSVLAREGAVLRPKK
ncbi:Metal-dependent hydrolases of the beta-lactamase superfamily I [hydrothermal vent metagenome]|uniref:Metal-dependent hydrolases of the beta-lactamase superfamily I n=1 Tax=hydrothermal vent metagenome TaxID=652676 RepID=A0A3B0S6N1_9ZZZZ